MSDATATPTPTPAPAPTPTPTPADSPDLAAVFRDLVGKHGSESKVAEVLLADNHRLRKKNATLKGSTVPEGATVLTGDDAQAWNEYKALGKAGDLKTALEEGGRSREELAGLRKAETHRAAAQATGFKESVLSRLIEQDKLTVEVKDETDKAGKPVKVAYARGVDAKDPEKLTKLSEHAAAAWKEFLPSLQSDTRPPALGTPSGASVGAGGHSPNPLMPAQRPPVSRRTAGI